VGAAVVEPVESSERKDLFWIFQKAPPAKRGFLVSAFRNYMGIARGFESIETTKTGRIVPQPPPLRHASTPVFFKNMWHSKHITAMPPLTTLTYLGSTPVKNIVQMPAKDVVYFFDPRNLTDTVPELYREDDLAHWLEDFSSTLFEDQLIKALIGHTTHVQARPPHWPKELVHRVIAGNAAHIDRHAWFIHDPSSRGSCMAT
jgi:hypothetical protein